MVHKSSFPWIMTLPKTNHLLKKKHKMDPPAGVVSSGSLALEDSPATNSKGVQQDRPSGNKKLHPTMNAAAFPADLLFFWQHRATKVT